MQKQRKQQSGKQSSSTTQPLKTKPKQTKNLSSRTKFGQIEILVFKRAPISKTKGKSRQHTQEKQQHGSRHAKTWRDPYAVAPTACAMWQKHRDKGKREGSHSLVAVSWYNRTMALQWDGHFSKNDCTMSMSRSKSSNEREPTSRSLSLQQTC